MKIFKILERYKKKRTTFYKSDEFNFYLLNRNALMKMPKFNYLTQGKITEFDIMRTNIVLHSYLNKVLIEEEVSNLQHYFDNPNNKKDYASLINALREKLVDQPYIRAQKAKIYIPFFSKAFNLIYLNDPMKLTKYPYVNLKEEFNDALIDPFDAYGYELYNSYFTRLIKISECDKTAGFFHYDTNTIYIINEQGRLDCKIVLFDRFIRKPNYNHMLERIRPVVDAYYKYDKKLLLEEMKKQGFISPHIFYLIKILDWRRKK